MHFWQACQQDVFASVCSKLVNSLKQSCHLTNLLKFFNANLSTRRVNFATGNSKSESNTITTSSCLKIVTQKFCEQDVFTRARQQRRDGIDNKWEQ